MMGHRDLKRPEVQGKDEFCEWDLMSPEEYSLWEEGGDTCIVQAAARDPVK